VQAVSGEPSRSLLNPNLCVARRAPCQQGHHARQRDHSQTAHASLCHIEKGARGVEGQASWVLEGSSASSALREGIGPTSSQRAHSSACGAAIEPQPPHSVAAVVRHSQVWARAGRAAGCGKGGVGPGRDANGGIDTGRSARGGILGGSSPTASSCAHAPHCCPAPIPSAQPCCAAGSGAGAGLGGAQRPQGTRTQQGTAPRCCCCCQQRSCCLAQLCRGRCRRGW
jgi:hypothetical protein